MKSVILNQQSAYLRDVYFASTPLHILLSTAVALRERQTKQSEAVLVCIDQQPATHNPYLALLAKFSTNPFVGIERLDRHQHFRNKLATRKNNFLKIQKLIDDYQPGRLFTGSDRRVEFQYAIASAHRYNRVRGIYLDEGTFSYVARKASQSFSDRYIDNWIKKCVYGRWWSNPPTTGASKWIDESWLFFPRHAHPLLQKKHIRQLQQQLFTDPAIGEFFLLIVQDQGVNIDKIRQATHVLTLPHHSLVVDGSAYVALLRRLGNQGAKVVLKFHPRSAVQQYPQDLQKYAWITLSGPLLFEALLPFFSSQTMLIGDFSSTLLIAKWLAPHSKIMAMTRTRYTNAYQQFLTDIDVDIASIDQILA